MLYDLTPPITDRLAVWPGDEPPTRDVKCHLKDGASVTLSALHSTVHLGAHADGANHYGVDAPGIEAMPLERYLGPCQVVTARVGRGERVKTAALARLVTEKRVLIRTSTYPDPTRFNRDFAALEPELVDSLAARGVILIGIDTPSVDLCDSKDLPAHAAFLRHGISILEGLVLTDVPDGVFELIALPLPLVGFDASPVRAVLRTIAEPRRGPAS
ncbi:MAG: cyclase family protein [Phycisphaerae bacterium]|nr:cyclase family protein [Phycisphaerae bacterium]